MKRFLLRIRQVPVSYPILTRFIMLRSVFVLSLCFLFQVAAFAPRNVFSRENQLKLVPVHVSSEIPAVSAIPHSNPLSEGTKNYLSSSQTLSLVERRAPTAEEIAEKKRNFNLWFWGGGVVAPFLATFYYFGFKFWER